MKLWATLDPQGESLLNAGMSESASPPSPALGQVAITLADVGKAVAFYRDILGLTFLFSPNENLAFLQAGDVRVMLSTPQGQGEPGKNSPLYFKVTSITETHAAMVAQGATDERAPALVAPMSDHDLWMGFLRDPEGNLVGLMEEVRPPAPR